MTRLNTISKLASLTAMLVAGVALIGSAQVANAKNSHRDDNGSMSSNNKGEMRDHGKRYSDDDHRKNKDKTKTTVKKTCLYITSDGKRCGGTSTSTGGTTKSGGNTPPAGTTPPSGTASNGPSTGHTTTVSNGVTKISVPDSPQGLIISSNSPGTITVFNGFTSQTFNGGSITLHGDGVASGATNIQTPGLQAIRLTNGDVSIGLKPTTPPPAAQPGGTIVRDHRDNKTITLTGDSIKTSGSDTMIIPKGTTIVLDHRDGKDPGVKITKNADGSYTAKATDENKGFVGATVDVAKDIGNGIGDFFGGNPFSVGSVPPAQTSTSVQQ